jgi:RimJ/RimL family protein N-acetyltransferase
MNDFRIAAAAASDEAAQRWLGWTPERLVAQEHRARLLAQRPGRGRWAIEPDGTAVVAIDPVSRRVAGWVSVSDSNEIGGYLAPEFRGRRLGRELFAGAAVVAHHHLGMATVRAGAELGNTASIRALLTAGFVSTDGPITHRLPNGRAIEAAWFRHDTDHPERCR